MSCRFLTTSSPGYAASSSGTDSVDVMVGIGTTTGVVVIGTSRSDSANVVVTDGVIDGVAIAGASSSITASGEAGSCVGSSTAAIAPTVVDGFALRYPTRRFRSHSATA